MTLMEETGTSGTLATVVRNEKSEIFNDRNAELYKVIMSAVGEAAEADVIDPVLFVGLRLLQHSERVVRLQPPHALAVRLPPSDMGLGDRLETAEVELSSLRAQLHKVELAEATKAMQALLGVQGDQPMTDLETWVRIDATTTIQAGFHGMMTRRWIRSLGLADTVQFNAAALIQAGMRGFTVRQWRRHLEEL